MVATGAFITASVAELDARPTGDQEVAGSTPPPSTGSATFFSLEIWSWNIFYDHSLILILSLPPNHEGQLSVFGERMCTILVNRLED